MTSQNAQCFTRSRFWVLEISCKIGVLKQSQSALFCSITHTTKLFIITCVMNVRYQSIQAFVTCCGPFRTWSCKFVHWPKNIRSSNKCQVQAFQNNLEAYLWQFSYRFHFFLFKVEVIDAWSRYFVELLSRLVCQLTISLHTFLRMTFHIIRPWRNTKILGVWKFCSSTCWNSWFKHGSVMVINIFAHVTLSLSAAQVYMIKERCWFSQSTSLLSTFHIGLMFCFFPANLLSST